MSGCPFKHPTCHRETEKLCPTLDHTGNRVCVLGAPTAIYKIVPRADGKVDLNLSYVHMEHLKLVESRGGEVEYDYSKLVDRADWIEKHGETLADHMRHLVSMGLLREYPIVGRSAVQQRLSEAGRKIVQMIRDREAGAGLFKTEEVYRGPR